MRDWTRHEKAKKLRDSGMTFKAVGEALGVGAARASDMVRMQERREAYQAYRAEHPEPTKWFDGLTTGTAYRLEQCGFHSRDDCLSLARGNLEMWRGSVVLDGWKEDRGVLWKWSKKKLSLAIVNEVRAWLGVKPFAPPQPEATAAELERAKRLLERHGYKVESPNG